MYTNAGLGQILPTFLTDPIAKTTGDQLAPEMVKEFGGVYPGKSVNDYVTEVGKAVAVKAKRQDIPYKFTVLADDKVVNAFALGNGQIFVTRAILDVLENEAELAGVLGHEVGHVNKRHINKSIEERLGFTALAELAKALVGKRLSAENQETLTKATDLGFNLAVNGFSRGHESEADEDGVDLSARAGYDPHGIVGVMGKFQSMEKGKEPSGIEYYLRSHPLARHRVADTTARINARYPGIGGRVGTAKYLAIIRGEEIGGAVAQVWETIKPYAVPAGIVAGSLGLAWVLTKVLVPSK